MASKSQQKLIFEKRNDQKHCKQNETTNARRTVSTRALTSDDECPMKFRVFLNGSNHWFLQSLGSCLDHKYHPKLDVSAFTLSEKDMTTDEQRLTSLLYDVNVPPSTILKILSSIKNDDVSIFLPKMVFNINEQCRSLVDVANGILPTTCSDAEKNLISLQL